jgi:hypothetical protein
VRSFSYREAAILLGGKQSKVVAALDKVTGGIMSALTLGVPDVLSWFDAKVEFVRLSHELVSSLVEAKRGIRRVDRTQRLEAAHTVVVMTAFFESFAELDLPFAWSDLAMLPEEQQALQRSSMQETGMHVGEWLEDPAVLPSPERAYEDNLHAIKSRYASMGHDLYRFVRRTSVWDTMDETAREKFSAQTRLLPDNAVQRYEELFRTMVAEFPEVACWANVIDHAATRTEVRALGASMAGLEKMLGEMAVGRAPSDRRAELARAYRAKLDEPVLPPGEASQLFVIPTVERAYVNPRFRVRPVYIDSRPGQESWWDEVAERDDIQQYLVGYLTSSQAASAPLVVLGQPGAGKSMLTKVLAARLPATDFLPVRVELRDVPAEADIQDQIEHAIRRATGDRVEWTDFARSAGDAVPVILLDGFDELLQATGAHQVDYLTKVSQFQKREADQGRPVAVILTTRIAVAGFARFPQESVALRIGSFDRQQVEQWVGIWNGANRVYFAEAGLSPLAAKAVLTYRDLAAQPLLLLMLALYDADKNALSKEGTISRSDLYERLLVQFARREVAKLHRGSDAELDRAVERELQRLSYVAFAMFNRGAQWVTQAELGRDLIALFGENTGAHQDRQGLRRKLDEAEIAIGRFFFIHRARAQQAERELEAYEFLHASFSEYLVARLTWKLVQAIAKRESTDPDDFFDRGPVNDSMLHALLSFAPLSSRAAYVRFLDEMAKQLSDSEREAVGSVLIRVFRTVHDSRADRSRENYRPRPVSVPHRHAAYSANLVILIVAALGEVCVSRLYGKQANVIGLWQRDALLWRSQIDYYSLIHTLDLIRIWNKKNRDIVLRLSSLSRRIEINLDWTYPEEGGGGDRGAIPGFYTDHRMLARQIFFASAGDDVLAHAVEPFVWHMDDAMTTFVKVDFGEFRSIANVLLDLLLPMSYQDRTRVYDWCAHVRGEIVIENSSLRKHCAELIVGRLYADLGISPGMAAKVLYGWPGREASSRLVLMCALRFLGIDKEQDLHFIRIGGHRLADMSSDDGETVAFRCELTARMVEVGFLPEEDSEWTAGMRSDLRELAESGLRPDLVRRGEWALRHLAGTAGLAEQD